MSGLLLQIAQALTDLVCGAEEMGLDRSRVQAGELRDLGDRELLEVLQHEDRLLAGRQCFDRLAKPLPDLARVRPALRRRLRVRSGLARPPFLGVLRRLVEVENETPALQPVLAPVDADPSEPGLEGRAFPELVQVLPGAEKALLRRAVRFSRIVQQPVRDSRDPALVL